MQGFIKPPKVGNTLTAAFVHRAVRDFTVMLNFPESAAHYRDGLLGSSGLQSDA